MQGKGKQQQQDDDDDDGEDNGGDESYVRMGGGDNMSGVSGFVKQEPQKTSYEYGNKRWRASV